MTSHQKLDEFSVAAFAAANLKITYVLTSTISIVTEVSGDARQNATVTIMNGSQQVWNATMTQAEPTATIGSNLIIGSVTIKAGGTFTLQIPTVTQPGSMTAALTLITPNNPGGIPFNAQVAQWPLSS
ncbi:hypothetical protein BLL37_31165 [Pseudomonas azotoformans]|uniref:Uncharacterized protein n=1 Tax=Pseudomonas azotoformans TaxID=47878 RepID=A0A1V2J588_PSEAZ|nr:hypothetical protein [Pseudomonas azotoformans]OIN45261.1 hypothetical protein BFL39_24470 [Pseudomonas azotoformans]ONH39821.1 hypothetical protein BLL37_31165 [Pseudomonas azotoformans]SDM97597.1 hypothetical protein SAMN04489799_0732 [Pseudomonas azotoformans]